ncbi:hypothetical protein [Bacillus mycoides]|uniref:hypothetical protein n=1 Tax=Bacillus mycoides TaxID=1405 RepID=UPI000A27F0ED|nr:hypothetical protein [Bacillus mycoides]OSY02620.1 hypothetical protein BTJ44_05677 [Bacillus mycoides]
MNLQEFKNVIDFRGPIEWVYDDVLGVYVYTQNIAITIEVDRTEGGSRDFYEEWVTKYPNSSATMQSFNLRYNGATIQKVYAVSVDGERMYIPLPQINEDGMTITHAQYNFGDVLNSGSSEYDRYLSMAGITIAEEELV